MWAPPPCPLNYHDQTKAGKRPENLVSPCMEAWARVTACEDENCLTCKAINKRPAIENITDTPKKSQSGPDAATKPTHRTVHKGTNKPKENKRLPKKENKVTNQRKKRGGSVGSNPSDHASRPRLQQLYAAPTRRWGNSFRTWNSLVWPCRFLFCSGGTPIYRDRTVRWTILYPLCYVF
jgi:hypothetical protein